MRRCAPDGPPWTRDATPGTFRTWLHPAAHGRPPSGHHRAPRPHPRRRLRVAAREGVARGGRAPRGRERLHPAADRPPRRPARAALRRDQGPHPRDRPVGADPGARALVLRALLRGPRVRRPRAACRVAGPDDWTPPPARRGRRPRPAGPARRGGAARPRRPRRRATTSSPSAARASAPTAACSPTPPTWSATSATRSASRTSTPATCCATRSSAPSAAAPGTAPASTSTTRPSTTPGAPTRSGATASAPPRPTTSWSSTRPTAGSGSACGRTRTDRFLVVASGSKTTSEYHVLDADAPELRPARASPPRAGGPRVLPRARRHRRRGPVPGAAQRRRPRLRARRRPRRSRRPASTGTPLIPHDPAVRLEDVDAFAGHLVVHQRSNGLTQLRILELGRARGRRQRRLPRGVRPRGLHRRLRRQPALRPADGAARLRHDGGPVVGLRLRRAHPRADPAQAGAGAGRLRPRRLRGAPALGDLGRRRAGADLAGVPPRRPRRAAQPLPLHLYAYGAYEMSIDPSFSIARLSLLDRGAAFAIAHVRGGGEMGRRWYDDGKLAHKQHTFDDFVACARHLVAEGWTTADRLVGEGAQRRRPAHRRRGQPGPRRVRRARRRRAVRRPADLDARRRRLPLTVTEYDEWGNPEADPGGVRRDRGVRAVRQRRAPSRYPRILAETSLPRHPGALRRAGQVGRPAARASPSTPDVLLRIEMSAGHGGVSGRYQAWKDRAFTPGLGARRDGPGRATC